MSNHETRWEKQQGMFDSPSMVAADTSRNPLSLRDKAQLRIAERRKLCHYLGTSVDVHIYLIAADHAGRFHHDFHRGASAIDRLQREPRVVVLLRLRCNGLHNPEQPLSAAKQRFHLASDPGKAAH